MPKCVIFLFKRFDVVTNKKISKKIDYPSSITLADKFDPEGCDYNLTGIVIHSGGMQGGHYTSICKKEDKWVLFNDAKTKEIKKKYVLDKDAYILFYQK